MKKIESLIKKIKTEIIDVFFKKEGKEKSCFYECHPGDGMDLYSLHLYHECRLKKELKTNEEIIKLIEIEFLNEIVSDTLKLKISENKKNIIKLLRYFIFEILNMNIWFLKNESIKNESIKKDVICLKSKLFDTIKKINDEMFFLCQEKINQNLHFKQINENFKKINYILEENTKNTNSSIFDDISNSLKYKKFTWNIFEFFKSFFFIFIYIFDDIFYFEDNNLFFEFVYSMLYKKNFFQVNKFEIESNNEKNLKKLWIENIEITKKRIEEFIRGI